MWVSWIGIGAGVAFQLEIGSATDFLFFHALWNAYVGALAYLYMPTHGGMLIHDEDEKTAMARAGGGDDDDDGGGGDRDLDGDGGGGGDARFAIGGYHDDDDDDTGRANGGPGDDGTGVELTEIQVMPGAGHAEEATLSSGSEDDGEESSSGSDDDEEGSDVPDFVLERSKVAAANAQICKQNRIADIASERLRAPFREG